MKPFLVTVGSVFALIVIAHLARMAVEPRLAHAPWFWRMTVIAFVLGVWAWRLVWNARPSRGPS